ncbi:MAG: ATP-dependent Clp protease ATP-binding subunit ClpX, partial [Bacteroidales bacterium]|nr:ATP-dependent Clp protease ATP-binding subunit ClpX [Bacteroidales bacterium]
MMCCLCGRTAAEVELMMPGLDGCICNECAEQAYLISKEYLKKKDLAQDIDLKKIPKPQEINDYL